MPAPVHLPRAARRAAVLVTAALLAPAAAHAAYAPKLAVRLDPPTAGASPAIASTITQASGEDASRSVRVSFPVGFEAPTAEVAVTACTRAQESQRACPDSSRMGSAAAATPLGAFAGSVHLGEVENGKIHLIVFLSNGIALFDQTLDGYVEIRSDGGFDTVFDEIPDVQTTSFELRLEGGRKSLLVNPRRCGRFVFTGRFTSQQGAQASSEAPVTIEGCPNKAPIVDELEVSPTTLRAGRGANVTFTLDEAASVRLTVKRLADRHVVLDRRLSGRVGRNRVRGIGGRLRPGRYRIDVRATDAQGATRLARTRLRVVAG